MVSVCIFYSVYHIFHKHFTHTYITHHLTLRDVNITLCSTAACSLVERCSWRGSVNIVEPQSKTLAPNPLPIPKPGHKPTQIPKKPGSLGFQSVSLSDSKLSRALSLQHTGADEAHQGRLESAYWNQSSSKSMPIKEHACPVVKSEVSILRLV